MRQWIEGVEVGRRVPQAQPEWQFEETSSAQPPLRVAKPDRLKAGQQRPGGEETQRFEIAGREVDVEHVLTFARK